MNREPRYVASHRPYAVDLSSWERTNWEPAYDGGRSARQTMTAIWFRRRRGLTVAHLGTLWDYSGADNAAEFLELHDDGRYGGDWVAAWDGDSVWTQNRALKTALDEYAAVLEAALAGFLDGQALPAGFDGWWTFAAQKET